MRFKLRSRIVQRNTNCSLYLCKTRSTLCTTVSRVLLLMIISIDILHDTGDRGSTVVNVLCHKSEGRWLDPSWYQWIFH